MPQGLPGVPWVLQLWGLSKRGLARLARSPFVHTVRVSLEPGSVEDQPDKQAPPTGQGQSK